MSAEKGSHLKSNHPLIFGKYDYRTCHALLQEIVACLPKSDEYWANVGIDSKPWKVDWQKVASRLSRRSGAAFTETYGAFLRLRLVLKL